MVIPVNPAFNAFHAYTFISWCLIAIDQQMCSCSASPGPNIDDGSWETGTGRMVKSWGEPLQSTDPVSR